MFLKLQKLHRGQFRKEKKGLKQGKDRKKDLIKQRRQRSDGKYRPRCVRLWKSTDWKSYHPFFSQQRCGQFKQKFFLTAWEEEDGVNNIGLIAHQLHR